MRPNAFSPFCEAAKLGRTESSRMGIEPGSAGPGEQYRRSSGVGVGVAEDSQWPLGKGTDKRGTGPGDALGVGTRGGPAAGNDRELVGSNLGSSAVADDRGDIPCTNSARRSTEVVSLTIVSLSIRMEASCALSRRSRTSLNWQKKSSAVFWL